MRYIRCFIIIWSLFLITTASFAAQEKIQEPSAELFKPYKIGVNDVLDIDVIRPDQLKSTVTVSPDGSITFPYIGNVVVRGLTLMEVQEEIQRKLADGYMKYPVVSVSLKTSRSKKFFIYGEVVNPGAYSIEENLTTLKSISMAGGFTKFGSSHVKVLRQVKGQARYQTLKININEVMQGKADRDIMIKEGDIIVVSEGMF